ncbi:MAG: CocE/NonD family hydrolase [Caulobacteraceae bacterium]|nr:CocE/NonD family hydrolase [Caulobacteraceae bacterium]
MRDGVKLHAVIVIPKGARGFPILLDRTPYDAAKFAKHAASPHLAAILAPAEAELAAAGYILVAQDVRGKYGSEGTYVNERPLRGPLNRGDIDHATDAWDTIDWLVRNVPESNGKVGMTGVSYDGMMVLMALADPHPALKAAAAINPVGDTWLGDDDFHGGAFRLIGYDYYYEQDSARGEGDGPPRGALDDYDVYLRAGSAWDFAKAAGVDQLPFPRRMAEHPAYDDFWRAQALQTLLPRCTLTVPTLYVAGQWDQEDIFGAIGVYEAVKAADVSGKRDLLVIGPWGHGGAMGEGSSLGALSFDGDTARHFRAQVLIPFLDALLKDGAPAADIAPVTAYETGTNVWRRYASWPQSCKAGCPYMPRALYLRHGGSLGFEAPSPAADGFTEYVSDPAKPIPYRPRPIRPVYADDSTWGQWLVDDQRNFSDRTDVAVWTSPALTAPVRIAGAPRVHLNASTSGTDADWVVKLIDVYPDEMPAKPALGGYQLMIAADIFRGRYRESLSAPRPIVAGKVEGYEFDLPNASHVFLAGHRIMVQVQSSWFPLYDRNPQTFVPNIFFAKAGDYRAAVQRIVDAGPGASFIDLPTTPAP